jgi:hypothetical protein
MSLKKVKQEYQVTSKAHKQVDKTSRRNQKRPKEADRKRLPKNP